MGYCVALNCTTSSGQGISLFTFPRDEKRKKAWVEKIRRDSFIPKKDSRLCAKHFENGQFVKNPEIMLSASFKPKGLRLKEDAMPTIFDYSKKAKKKNKKVLNDEKRKRPVIPNSEAFHKRRKLDLEVLSALLPSYVHDEVSSHQQNESDVPLEELVLSHPTIVEREACETLLQLQTTAANPTEMGIGTENIKKFNTSSQTTYNLIFRRHVKMQTEVATTEIGVQTDAIEFVREPVIISVMSECSDTDSASPDWTPVYESDDSVDEDECIEAVDFSKL